MAVAFETFPRPFGRYVVERKLGQGGMGAVYLATDTVLDRKVALKIPTIPADDSGEMVERLHREAKAAASLQHSNLCAIYDVGNIEGTDYLAMPFIEGRPLSDLVESGQPLDPREAVALVRKIASALYAAHRKGIVHRDLKPANVMLTADGEPIVMDFGLARRSQAADVKLTQSGAIIGTPAYMSPEQVMGQAKTLGPATDIYSLGVILYELLTGRLPFEGPAAMVLAQIVSKKAQPPSSISPGVDRRLDAICRKAMAKKPEDRFRTAAEFAEALEAWDEPETATKSAPAAKRETTRISRPPTQKIREKNSRTPQSVKREIPANPDLRQIVGLAIDKLRALRRESPTTLYLSCGGGAMTLLVLVIVLTAGGGPTEPAGTPAAGHAGQPMPAVVQGSPAEPIEPLPEAPGGFDPSTAPPGTGMGVPFGGGSFRVGTPELGAAAVEPPADETPAQRLRRQLLAGEAEAFAEVQQLGTRAPGDEADARQLVDLLATFQGDLKDESYGGFRYDSAAPIAGLESLYEGAYVSAPRATISAIGRFGSDAGSSFVDTAAAARALKFILDALRDNHAPPALEALREAVIGQRTFGLLTPQARRSAFDALVATREPAVEAFLAEIVKTPEILGTGVRGQYGSDPLVDLAVQALDQMASTHLRRRLAEELLSTTLGPTEQKRVQQIVLSDRSENVPAQVMILESGQADAALRETLRLRLLKHSGQSLSMLLEYPEAVEIPSFTQPTYAYGDAYAPTIAEVGTLSDLPAPVGFGTPTFGSGGETSASGGIRPRVDPEALRRQALETAQWLWTPQFVQAIASENGSLRDRVLPLTVIPSTSARARILAALESDWAQGAASVSGTAMAEPDSVVPADPFGRYGLLFGETPTAMTAPVSPDTRFVGFGKEWLDPGLLVVLKMLPRAERPERTPPSRTRRSRSPQLEPPPPDKRELEVQARFSWFDASEQYLETLRQRLTSSARLQRPASEGTAEGALEAAWTPLGIAAPPGATLVSRYDFELRGDEVPVAEGASPPEPFSVHYLRAEITASLDDLEGHFRVQLGAAEDSEAGPAADSTGQEAESFKVRRHEAGRWLDCLAPGSAGNTIRSVDVLLTTDDASAVSRGSLEAPFTIEALVIEIPRIR